MLTALFILVVLAGLGGIVLVYGLLTAPEGHENETGFHPIRKYRSNFNAKLQYSKPFRSRHKLTRMV